MQELEAAADGCKKIAGFSRDALNASLFVLDGGMVSVALGNIPKSSAFFGVPYWISAARSPIVGHLP